MNCNDVRRHWEVYYDSEGDSELYLQVNDHLAECPRCAKWFFQQGQFDELVTTKLSAGEATPELWQRLRSEIGLTRPVAARGRMFFSPFWALAASLLLVVGIWQIMPWTGEVPERIAALTAVVHRQFAEDGKRVEFSSLSDREVEQYLKQRVSFAVRCPPRQDAGFAVRGGGVCTIAGDTAAYVVGQVGENDVSVIIFPEERLARFAWERDLLRRETVYHCREGEYELVLAKIDRNIIVVVGKASPERLEQVVRAYGTYPENRPPTTRPKTQRTVGGPGRDKGRGVRV